MKRSLIVIAGVILIAVVAVFVYYKYSRYQADVVITNVSGDDICSEGENAQNSPSDCFKTITWGGGTPTWNQDLGISGSRMGCTSPPESCMTSAGNNFNNLANDGGKIYISIDYDANLVENYALQYSQLSIDKPWLKEISLDDFAGVLYKWQVDGVNIAEKMTNVLANTKSANSKLSFGITLYEDNFGNSILSEKNLPLSVREKIDIVHLYVHYRSNGANYASYVDQVKTLFPNAKIIAGSYNYDRIDYLQCSQGNDKTKCTRDEEVNLFKQALQIQVDLLKNRQIYAIEFYPGFFADPATWKNWQNSRSCLPERLAECAAVTVEMDQIVLEVYNLARGISGTDSNQPVTNESTTTEDQQSVSLQSGGQQQVASNDQKVSTTTAPENTTSASNDVAPESDQQDNLTTSGASLSDNIILSLFFALVAVVLIWYGSTFVTEDSSQ